MSRRNAAIAGGDQPGLHLGVWNLPRWPAFGDLRLAWSTASTGSVWSGRRARAIGGGGSTWSAAAAGSGWGAAGAGCVWGAASAGSARRARGVGGAGNVWSAVSAATVGSLWSAASAGSAGSVWGAGSRAGGGARGLGSAPRVPKGPAGPGGAAVGGGVRVGREVVGLGNLRVPESLVGRVFLLACDSERGRLVARAKVGKVLRAAALVDLVLAGNLVDDNGKARVTAAPAPGDPVLAAVLEDMRAAGPRRWKHWVERRPGATVRRVRDELDRARLIKVEPHRILGIVPADRITVRHPLMRRQLLQAAHDTLRASRLVSRVDLRDASIVVLAATADLRTIVTKDQRIRHKDRLAQLAVRIGPVVPALKKSIQQAQYSAAG